jgi:hypothetical protein
MLMQMYINKSREGESRFQLKREIKGGNEKDLHNFFKPKYWKCLEPCEKLLEQNLRICVVEENRYVLSLSTYLL